MDSKEMTVKVDGPDLIMERTFDAPRDVLFKMFSDSEHLAAWWGPKGWDTENQRFEFYPEGVWHYCMTCNDESQGEFYGQQSWGKAIYKNITVPEKIEYLDVFSDEEGNTSDMMPPIDITMTFHEEDGKTNIVFISKFPSEEELNKIMEMGMIEGFSSQNECLDEYLKSQV
ncbi:SRPBCC family protein [Virgibacillus flavescens]|uniref:SRPBCC family protein n=1 Tax=Virgibacillus flavescens TaxID=1611422 RepID=UPI003D352BE5